MTSDTKKHRSVQWVGIVVMAISLTGASAWAQSGRPGERAVAVSDPPAWNQEAPPPVDNAPKDNAPKKEKVRKLKTGGKYDVTKIGNRGIGKGVNLYSIEREREMGRELAANVETSARLITDPMVTEYVNRIGQNIVRNSDAKVPFTIKVLDDDQVNAFALPGGYFFVNSGLIMAAENEAEFAGAMAHEIAHVAARHATKMQTRSEIMNLASIPLIFFGGPAGFAVRQAMGLAVPLSFLKFSRNEEREADLLGMEYQYAAGYDPSEFVHFFETLQAREKGKKGGAKAFIAQAFATHPMTGDRIKRAQQEMQERLPPKELYVVDTSEFDQVKTRLAEIEKRNRIQMNESERPVLRRRTELDKK